MAIPAVFQKTRPLYLVSRTSPRAAGSLAGPSDVGSMEVERCCGEGRWEPGTEVAGTRLAKTIGHI